MQKSAYKYPYIIPLLSTHAIIIYVCLGKWIFTLESKDTIIVLSYFECLKPPISIRVHLQKSKVLNFEALRISLGFQLHSSKSELPWQFQIAPKDIWITLDFE